MSNYSQVTWSIPVPQNPNNPSDVALFAVEAARDAATAFDDLYHDERQRRDNDDSAIAAVPRFASEEISTEDKPHRTSGYFAEYSLTAVHLNDDEEHVGDEAKRRFVEMSEDRCYAIKYLQNGLVESQPHAATAAAEMILETKVLQTLLTTNNRQQHPNICSLYGVHESGVDALLRKDKDSYFLVTDKIKETLEDRLANWRRSTGDSAAATRRLEVALDAASVLRFLHDRQLVYYLTPAKVGFDARHGRLKLTNMGQCRIIGSKDHPANVVRSDCVGTLAYAAPEVFCRAAVTPAIDAYGLGVLLWELLSLQQPCQGYDRSRHYQEVVLNHKRPFPMSKETWPASLTELLTSCWDPYKRPTMETIHKALENVLLFEAEQLNKLDENLRSIKRSDEPCNDTGLLVSPSNILRKLKRISSKDLSKRLLQPAPLSCTAASAAASIHSAPVGRSRSDSSIFHDDPRTVRSADPDQRPELRLRRVSSSNGKQRTVVGRTQSEGTKDAEGPTRAEKELLSSPPPRTSRRQRSIRRQQKRGSLMNVDTVDSGGEEPIKIQVHRTQSAGAKDAGNVQKELFSPTKSCRRKRSIHRTRSSVGAAEEEAEAENELLSPTRMPRRKQLQRTLSMGAEGAAAGAEYELLSPRTPRRQRSLTRQRGSLNLVSVDNGGEPIKTQILRTQSLGTVDTKNTGEENELLSPRAPRRQRSIQRQRGSLNLVSADNGEEEPPKAPRRRRSGKQENSNRDLTEMAQEGTPKTPSRKSPARLRRMSSASGTPRVIRRLSSRHTAHTTEESWTSWTFQRVEPNYKPVTPTSADILSPQTSMRERRICSSDIKLCPLGSPKTEKSNDSKALMDMKSNLERVTLDSPNKTSSRKKVLRTDSSGLLSPGGSRLMGGLRRSSSMLRRFSSVGDDPTVTREPSEPNKAVRRVRRGSLVGDLTTEGHPYAVSTRRSSVC